MHLQKGVLPGVPTQAFHGTYRVASVWGNWEAPGSWRLSTSGAWELLHPGLTLFERPMQIPPSEPVGIRETRVQILSRHTGAV